MPNTAKYHHLVPKNYLDPWAKDQTVQWEKEGEIQPQSTGSLLDLHYFHSITAGSPLATKADTDILFEEMEGLRATYGDQPLDSTLRMNQEFEWFEDWVLQRKDGSSAKKKPLKHAISQVKIDTEEEGWEEAFSDLWREGLEKLQSRFQETPSEPLSREDFAFFLGLSWVMDWNTWTNQPLFQEMLPLLPFLKKINLPRMARQFPYVTSQDDELKQWLLTSQFRQFLEKEGALWHWALGALEGLSFQFFTNETPLPTGEKPSFQFGNVGYFVLHPQILLVIRDSDSNSCAFASASPETWAEFQQVILQAQTEWIIHPEK